MAVTNAPGVLRAGPPTYAGLFVVTMTTLMYEIILTRIFSVTMWYHFAFVAISVALLGMTVGALAVYLLPAWFTEEQVERRLWSCSLLFAISIAGCFLTQLAIPFDPGWTLVGAWSVALTCAVISVPFMFSGIVVCLALTKFPDRVNRLYAADLVGAAVGCIALVMLLDRFDGPSAVIAIAALAALGSLLFAIRTASSAQVAAASAAFLLMGAFALVNASLHDEGRPWLRIAWVRGAPERIHSYETWNAFSRVTVDGDASRETTPSGYGMSSTLSPGLKARQLLMAIDVVAGTPIIGYAGDPDTTDFLRYDITNLAHYALKDGDVLVVGVGGGRDVLAALEFEQRSVTGVEINPNILDLLNERYGGFSGHLNRDPRVSFVNDEARSYVARSDRTFDLIHISLIDTFAASSAGAYALTENSLYTVEAWHEFLDHLSPQGLLSVSRWHSINGKEPFEMYRVAALAGATLKQRGAQNPRDHVVIYSTETGIPGTTVATLMISPEPISPAAREILDDNARRLKFDPVITADYAVDPVFAGLLSPAGPEATVSDYRYDIGAPTDDRPFFFQMATVDNLFDGSVFDDVYIMRPVKTVLMLSAAVLALTLLCVVAPLIVTSKRSAHRGMGPFYTFFMGIGFGFLLIEVSQLQRLSVFLGHPTYALTVVLFSLLLSSGLGSMLSERLLGSNRGPVLLAPLATLLVAILVFGIITPEVIARYDGATTPARIALAVAVLMPLGFVMGMPFPLGMRAASLRPSAPTAFFWGINGATSVCASVVGMMIALLWGISAVFWTGAAAYVLATVSLALIVLVPRWQIETGRPPATAETSI